MLVYLIKSNEITSLRLPNKIQGNYFISYNKKGKQINLINIKAEDNRWIISSNVDVRIIQNNQTMQKETLREYNFYELLAYNTEKMYLYVMPLWDETYRKYTLCHLYLSYFKFTYFTLISMSGKYNYIII